MRIAVGQLWQETNTLNPGRTTRADFEAFGVCRGVDLVREMAETNEPGGFIQSLRSWPERPEIVGLVRLPAWPGGPLDEETFDWVRDEMLAALEAALPLDAVLLALHGAMVAVGHPDAEGDVTRAMRDRVGPDVPIVATLDLHANVTRQLVEAATALVTYHSMPHVDIFETGRRGAAVLRRILFEEARPVTALAKIPAVVPAEQSNTEAESGIAADLKRVLQELEKDPRILSAGVTPVQPWMDIPELGSAVLVVADGDADLAEERCRELAAEFWRRRREYLPELVSIEDAIQQARRYGDGLVVLSDAADATTSGAPGDSVWILEGLLQHSWPNGALATVVDPELVEKAQAAGPKATLDIQLGGRRDSRFGKAIALRATVAGLFEARFTMTGHIGKNLAIDMGPSAVLQNGDVRVIATTRSGPHFSPELFQSAGLDPFAASVLVAKSPCGFRAVYTERAAAIINVRAPGCAPSDFWNYEFQQIDRPLWPWDPLDDWRPQPILVGGR